MPRRRARELLQAHIRTVMTDQLITVGPEASLVEVGREIAAHGIGGVPVVDGEQRLLGLVVSGDLVHLVQGGGRLDDRVAADVMTAQPISIDEFATCAEAIGVMQNAMIRHLPVTREGRLVGMVTATDLIRHLIRSYPAPEVA